jgi:SAM-dependent methyltransferase
MKKAVGAGPTWDDGIDWRWSPQAGESEFHDSLVRAVLRQIPHNSRTLEIGVGNGYLLSQLAQRAACTGVGVDRLGGATTASQGTAAFWGASLQLVRGSGFALPFQDGAFDVVMSHGVIEHYSKARARDLLAEHARVCRPGGIVLVSTPNSLDLLHSVRRWWLGKRYCFFPERSYSLWALARELRRHGLTPTMADGYAPLWSLRQTRIAYPLVAILHKTGVLSAVATFSRPWLLSVLGSFVLLGSRKPSNA